MEICHYQSIESRMPPKTDREYGDTSFTSIPPALIDAVRDLARKKNVYLYELFAEAISDLNARAKAGEKIEWPVARPRPANRGYHTRLEVSVLEDLRNGIAKSEVKANIYFMAALRDYLRKQGIEIEL
jgi:hypothetical protein